MIQGVVFLTTPSSSLYTKIFLNYKTILLNRIYCYSAYFIKKTHKQLKLSCSFVKTMLNLNKALFYTGGQI